MNGTVSSKSKNIFTESVEHLACRICFTFDNVQDTFQCSYNYQTISEIVNIILLSRLSSNNLVNLCMNCVKDVISVHLFLQKLTDRKTFWENALLRPRVKSSQIILLPSSNDDASLYDEKLLRIGEVSIRNEKNIDKRNADSGHEDYHIIENEVVGLTEESDQGEDMPDYFDVHDDNRNYSNFDDEDDLPLIRLVTMATREATTNSSIRVPKESSTAGDDIKLKAKRITIGTSKTVKADNTSKQTPTKKLKGKVLCKECGKMYSRGFIGRHRMHHKMIMLLKCDVCGFSINEKYLLARHMKLHDKVEKLVCRFCDSIHDNLYDYKNHMKTHNVKRVNYRDLTLNSDAKQCKVCGKTYALALSLAAHMRTHDKDRGTWCTYCQKGFPSSSLYRIHMRIHTGEKPYACPHCPNRYRQKAHLKIHIEGHDNKREYGCDFCPKTYNAKHMLEQHRRIHTGDKHNCQYCSRPFVCKYNLKAHIRNLHPDSSVSRQKSARRQAVVSDADRWHMRSKRSCLRRISKT